MRVPHVTAACAQKAYFGWKSKAHRPFGTVVLRDNTPIIPVSPKPVVVPQPSRTVEASSIGLDPDGQAVESRRRRSPERTPRISG